MPTETLALLSSHLCLVPSLCCALALGAISTARAADGLGRVGVFEDHSDVGNVSIPGTAAFDADTQEYAVSSSGTNMWTDHDEFHYVWKKVKGDFILQARPSSWAPDPAPTARWDSLSGPASTPGRRR